MNYSFRSVGCDWTPKVRAVKRTQTACDTCDQCKNQGGYSMNQKKTCLGRTPELAKFA